MATAAKRAPAKKTARKKATAESMASQQREISISEFFTKNRHLLGFDTPAKALLTTIKEAVDNSLDACEEAGILPDLEVEIQPVPSREPLPHDRRGQRARHREGPDPADLRQAALRLEVPLAASRAAASRASASRPPACTAS